MRIETNRFSIEDNRTYIIVEDGHAILVDASSDDLVDILKRKGYVLDYIFLTHEHCDHIWGLNRLRDEFLTPVIATKKTSEAIGDYRLNRSCVHHIYITMKFGIDASKNCTPNPALVCSKADIEFENHYSKTWMGHELKFYSTPGHSKGSGMMVIDNEYLFSGDTVLKGQEVFTSFEGGNIKEYNEITLPLMKTFAEDMVVYPGHGDSFKLYEYELKEM